MNTTILLYSGGIDSTVLLYDLRSRGREVLGLGFEYGQSHRRELEAAAAICSDLGVEYDVLSLPSEAFSGSTLTGEPSGSLVVPNRNMVFIALAASVAEMHGGGDVAIAFHSGDFDRWPDCRPAFGSAMFDALRLSTEGRVCLRYPYARISKLDVIRRGIELGVPFEKTWSCYGRGPEPCEGCVACRSRREGLFLAGAVPA